MRRRSFVVAGVVGGVGSAALLACRPWTRATPRADEPTEHELATLAAIAETFLPGGQGAPGAGDTGALAAIVEPAYGLRPYLAQVVADLDDWVAFTRGLHTFVELSPESRDLALEQRMGLHGDLIKSWYLPVYEAILALTKVAFYGGRTSRFGTSYIGFPGPSAGYAPDSAAGAHASRDLPRALAIGAASTIHVAGAGTVTRVHASALATSDAAVTATLRVTAPDGRRCDLALRVAAPDGAALFAGGIAAGTRRLDDAAPLLAGGPAAGTWRLDDAALPLTGGPAAGAWRLEVVACAGAPGVLALWSLRLRTDLDDRPDAAPGTRLGAGLSDRAGAGPGDRAGAGLGAGPGDRAGAGLGAGLGAGPGAGPGDRADARLGGGPSVQPSDRAGAGSDLPDRAPELGR